MLLSRPCSLSSLCPVEEEEEEEEEEVGGRGGIVGSLSGGCPPRALIHRFLEYDDPG